jgi:hypothetical protein
LRTVAFLWRKEFPMRCRRIRRHYRTQTPGAALVVAAAVAAWTGAAAPAAGQGHESAIVINGAALAPETLKALQSRYQTQIPPGRYWYDAVSSVWGREGGPAEGQIAPGHALGGPLRADTSRGNTRVFVNGRELHALDVQALQRCTQVVPGRYWVEASGIGGYEGGPPAFNLAALCSAFAGGRRGGGSTRTECHSNGCQSTNHVTGGGVITDGRGGGAVFIPGGGMVMTPN